MGSLLDRAHELARKMGEIGLKNLVWLKKTTKTHVLHNFKGSRRDPLLYLGLIAVILFSIISFTSPVPSFTNTAGLLISEQGPQQGDLFVAPGTKIKESPGLIFIQKNSLVAVSPPIMVTPQVLGALIDASDYEWIQREITEYIVEEEDSLGLIAEKFDISLDTLLWANSLTKNTTIQIGQKLIVLPTSGVVHHVKKDDTLSQIAKIYKSEVDKIVAFNNLVTEDDIFIGDILIVPGGVMPPPTTYVQSYIPIASSYFIPPISSPYYITQGLHWYNAIDFSNGKCGTPIRAAAAGTVLKVKLTSSRSKWAFGGAGNHLTILHLNGVVTYYGHIQTSLVNTGDYVSQGQIIALMGGMLGTPGAGSSTGCHVHFGVSGARNPFNR